MTIEQVAYDDDGYSSQVLATYDNVHADPQPDGSWNLHLRTIGEGIGPVRATSDVSLDGLVVTPHSRLVVLGAKLYDFQPFFAATGGPIAEVALLTVPSGLPAGSATFLFLNSSATVGVVVVRHSEGADATVSPFTRAGAILLHDVDSAVEVPGAGEVMSFTEDHLVLANRAVGALLSEQFPDDPAAALRGAIVDLSQRPLAVVGTHDAVYQEPDPGLVNFNQYLMPFGSGDEFVVARMTSWGVDSDYLINIHEYRFTPSGLTGETLMLQIDSPDIAHSAWDMRAARIPGGVVYEYYVELSDETVTPGFPFPIHEWVATRASQVIKAEHGGEVFAAPNSYRLEGDGSSSPTPLQPVQWGVRDVYGAGAYHRWDDNPAGDGRLYLSRIDPAVLGLSGSVATTPGARAGAVAQQPGGVGTLAGMQGRGRPGFDP